MSTEHQRKYGFNEQIKNAKSLGEAQEKLAAAKLVLPANSKALKKCQRSFDKLSFGKD